MKYFHQNLSGLKLSVILIILFFSGLSLSCAESTPKDLREPGTISMLLEETFQKPYEQISEVELRELTRLNIGYFSKNLTSLEGIEVLTGLNYINITNTNIKDLTPLKQLTKLEYLYLSGNKITDISPLADLSNLKRLKLSRNQINDLTPIKGLKNLNKLIISFNQIADLSVVSNLSNLNSLACTDNQISDISPLASLEKLYFLVLNINQIKDISPLGKLPKLNFVILDNNLIGDDSVISDWEFFDRQSSEYKNDSYISLENNKISELTGFAGAKIKTVTLENNQISDLAPIINNPGGIRFLIVNNNPLSNDAVENQIPALVKMGIKVRWNDQNFE